MNTPHLDKLASEGRLFKRHYVQAPTCGTSRLCLLTGRNLRSTSDIGHYKLANRLAGQPETEEPETFIHHLKRNGYFTVGMGKISHTGDGLFKAKDGPLDHELPHSWNRFVNDPDSPWEGGSRLVAAYAHGKSKFEEKGLPFESHALEDEAYPDGRLSRLAVAELEKLAVKKEPFFLAVGFYKPHLPFGAPKKYWDLYERSEIPLSPDPNPPEGVSETFLSSSVEFFTQYIQRETGGKGKRVSDAYAREVIHGYFAAVSYVDAQIGKVISKLETLGLAGTTAVVVWGDHGWHLGDHTVWGKHTAFERALNSALIVKLPGMSGSGKETDALVASIDLYPTLCDIAGVSPPNGLEGKSFMPVLNDPSAKVNEAVASFWKHTLSVRTDRYRFALFDDGERKEAMLFDHDRDPDETVNLARSKPEVVETLMPTMRRLNRGYLPRLP